MIVFTSLGPLVLIVILGALLRRSGFTPAGLYQETNRLVYWVALPSLLFDKTSRGAAVGSEAMRLFAALLAATLACVVLGYVVAALLRLPRRSVGAFVQAGYRGNLAYVGLPVILFSLAEPAGPLGAIAALALAPLVPLYNLIAVIVLLAGQGARPERLARRLGGVTLKIATNPLLLACLAGLAVSLLGWSVPSLLQRGFQTVGQMALPLALLGIGATMTFRSLHDGLLPAAAATAIKTIAAPLLGAAFCLLLAVPADQVRIALIYLACPTAVVSFVMAERLGGDEHLSSGAIVLSTLVSAAALAVVLLLT